MGKTDFRNPILPAVAATVRLSHSLALYLNHARIYQPQIYAAADGRPFLPVTEATYEAKLNFVDDAHDLSASLSFYYEDVDHLAVPIAGPSMGMDCCHEPAQSARSHGLDAECNETLRPVGRCI